MIGFAHDADSGSVFGLGPGFGRGCCVVDRCAVRQDGRADVLGAADSHHRLRADHTVSRICVFVVRADSTPPQAVVRSLQNLRGVAGLVFNGVSPGSFRRYYYYDAYSRYAYGDDLMEDDEESKHV